MYLPHLDEGEFAVVAEAGSGASMGAGSHPAGGASAMAGEAASTATHDGEARIGAVASQMRSDVEHLELQLPRGAGDRLDGGDAGAIRGRGAPPGAGAQLRPGGQAHAADGAPIRGHDQVPGPPAGLERGREQRRLDARNSLLARSLADHADRVAKRDLQGDRQRGASAAERIAALRRRISARRGTEGATEAREAAHGAHGSGVPEVGHRDGRREEAGGDDISNGGDAVRTERGDRCSTRAEYGFRGGAEDLESEFVTAMAADGDVVGAGTPESGAAGRDGEPPRSNEDQKMHHLSVHGGRIHDDAAAGLAWDAARDCSGGAVQVPHVAVGGGRHTVGLQGERQGYVAPPPSDIADAASRVAWHAVVPSL